MRCGRRGDRVSCGSARYDAMHDGLVGASSYARPDTIEANGTAGDPVAPPPASHAGNAPDRRGEARSLISGG